MVKWIIECVVLVAIFYVIKSLLTKKKKAASAPASAPQPEKPVAAPVARAPSVKKIGVIPQHANGQPLLYSYDVEFVPSDGVDVAGEILAGEEKLVQVGYEDDDVILVYEGVTFGRIHDASRAKMVKDYLDRGNPVGAVLRANGVNVMLLFYRDQRIGNEWREQEVVTLQGYKGRAKQEQIEWAEPGDPLEIEEDDEHDGRLNVLHKGEDIGWLPAKVAKRCQDDGPAIVVMEKVEESFDDNEKRVYIPSVRLMW